jgi:hypothetical protein
VNRAAAGALAVVLAGCGTRAAAPAAPSGASPGDVALGYVNALFRKDFTSAKSLVAPSDRGAFSDLVAALGAGALSSRDLRVGHTTVTGAAATSVLLGTLCSGGNCMTNTDSSSANPVFAVQLSEGSDGRWMVVFGSGSGPAGAPPQS